MDKPRKIVDINQAKTSQEMIENNFLENKQCNEKEILIPKEAWEFLNNKMSNLQGTVEQQSSKMDAIIDVAGNLMNELRKQTIEEKRPAAKISRKKGDITVSSTNRHLDFYIFTGHIAELFQIYTKDKKNFSSSSASNMLKELGIKDDNNFSYLDPSSKKIKVRKYSYDVFEEVVDRLKNPDKYELNIETTSKWITKCGKLPAQQEIDSYREAIKEDL